MISLINKQSFHHNKYVHHYSPEISEALLLCNRENIWNQNLSHVGKPTGHTSHVFSLKNIDISAKKSAYAHISSLININITVLTRQG